MDCYDPISTTETEPEVVEKPPLPQKASPLFRLPLELRLCIFDHLLRDDPPLTKPLSDDPNPCTPGRSGKRKYSVEFVAKAMNASSNILSTCRRCRDEALPVFFRHLTLCINSHNTSSESFGSHYFQLEILSSRSIRINGSARQDGIPSRRQPARVKIDFSLVQNLTILLPVEPISNHFLEDLKQLLYIFPRLRLLTLRVVYITFLGERPDQDEYITMATPGGPMTHALGEFYQDQRAFWYRGSYDKLVKPEDRMQHWLTRELHRLRIPSTYKPQGGLSADRVIGQHHDRMKQLLLKNVLGQETYRDEGWEQFLEIDRLLMVSGLCGKSLSKLDVVLEGEMRVIRLEPAAASEERSIKAENHVDTLTFEVDLGIVKANMNGAETAGAAAAAAVNGVQSVEDEALTKLRKIRIPGAAEMSQRLQQLPLDEFSAYREGRRSPGAYHVVYV